MTLALPKFVILTAPKEMFNKWLCIFVNKTYSKDGNLYSPKTIQSLLAKIVHSVTLENPTCPNFLSIEDPALFTFQIVLDKLFGNLHSYGDRVKSCLSVLIELCT